MITPNWKPAKGTKKRERAKRTHNGRRLERREKALVRKRDISCRVPNCPTPVHMLTVAHLHHKGAGGNPTNSRSTKDQMIFLCYWHHQGPRGYDGMYPLSIRPMTDQGTDGLCEFKHYSSEELTYSVPPQTP